MSNTVSDAYDYYITAGTGNTSGAAAVEMGYSNGIVYDAGNSFSTFTSIEHNISNSGLPIYYYAVAGVVPPNGNNINTTLVTTNVQSNTCPTKINTGGLAQAAYLSAAAELYIKIGISNTTPISGSYGSYDLLMQDYHDLTNYRLQTLMGMYDGDTTTTDSTGVTTEGTIVDLEGTLNLLTSLPYDYKYQIMAADLQVQQHNFAGALGTLNGIPSKFAISADVAADITNQATMVTILETLYNNGYDYAALTDADRDMITTMADNDGKAGYIARGLLTTYTGVFYAPNLIPAPSDEITGNEARKSINTIATNSSVLAYPNPVKDQLTFSGLEAGAHSIIILDMNGKTMLKSTLPDGQNTVNMKMLPDGIYQLTLISKTGSAQSFKVNKQ
jgi:hypothetical protein